MSSMKKAGEIELQHRSADELDARATALRVLAEGRVPFLVAGAYAHFEYTGVERDTKDLDVFLRREHVDRALDVLETGGFTRHLEDPLWIAKAFRGEWFVDVIFSSGNGIARVDDGWFEHAKEGEVMGVKVLLAPAEEMIWSKAFVCERERYDGNDVVNLVRACGRELDWERLLERFDDRWEVLLSHLVLYRFSFPSERSQVPRWVMSELLHRSLAQLPEQDPERRICRGTLLSKVQYQHAVERDGFEDERGQLRELLLGGGSHGGTFPARGGG
jgi:nucleotidyltransferase DUF2204